MKHPALLSLAALLVLPLAGLRAAEATDARLVLMPRRGDYTLLWWADGPPYGMESKSSPTSETLCFRSGYWGLALDTKGVQVLRAGEWGAPMGLEKAVQPGRPALDDLPAVLWDCAVVANGRQFACVGHMETNDAFFQPVRFVESGRFFQRVVIEGLRFADSTGEQYPCDARLEISAWPDRLAFRLDLESQSVPAGGTVELRLGDHRTSTLLAAKTSARLEVFGDNTPPRPKVEADSALKVRFDEVLGCHTLQLPENPLSNEKGTYYPAEHLDRLDRWRVTLRNDSDRETTARLIFTQKNQINLTGFTPMLCDSDGTPTGLPVQISKNWHRRPDKGTLPYEGPWFHGCAFVRLPPKAKHDLVFQMVYARYGGVFAASHAQLSLIGWGHNQFWDQAAIGSFGESICFEPGRVQRRCFIDDVRPLMTLPQGKVAKPWGWADNCGGGDFLMWQDAQGSYQPMRATRTDYRAYGPCLTDVSYSEETAGGELSARMDVSVPRCEDYLRAFIHLRYDVRRPMQWQRLAFCQLGSDFYNETPARRVAVGDLNGLRKEWEPKPAKDLGDRYGVPLMGAQPWLSIHGVELAALRPESAAASRGLIVRAWRAVLGGKPAPPHATFFCTQQAGGERTVVALAPPPSLEELLPGDFVEADLELVVFPAEAAAYYGPDQDFRAVLARDADTWRLVQREAVGNALKTEALHGAVLKPYPLRISANDGRAEVTVRGGLGYVPVTFTGLASPDGYALFVDERRVNQSVQGNDFWQTDYDAATQRWQQTFNFLLSSNHSSRVRFQRIKPN